MENIIRSTPVKSHVHENPHKVKIVFPNMGPKISPSEKNVWNNPDHISFTISLFTLEGV